MNSNERLKLTFGTDEQVARPLEMRAGDFRCIISEGSVRELAWRDTEVVRSISVLVRDENWGTYVQSGVEEVVFNDGDTTRYQRTFSIASGDLTGDFSVELNISGRLSAKLKMVAHKDFLTNRAGLTLLHPIAGVAGANLHITHSSGVTDNAIFPELISPDQPVLDIVAMQHRVQNVDIDIKFGGEIFEMEDQRNWSDASFKTYCRPLSRPYPYEIKAGEILEQNINISLKTQPDSRSLPAKKANSVSKITVSNKPTGCYLPEILVASEPDWATQETDFQAVSDIKPDGLLLRIDQHFSRHSDWLRKITQLCRQTNAYCDLEIIVPETDDPVRFLHTVSDWIQKNGLIIRHVLALPASYLKSYQPDGDWPRGLTPGRCATAAKTVFPNAKIGMGMLTNFTELNRARPDVDLGDYISHGTTAILHAADDISVLQTLHALPSIFATTRSFSNDRVSRLGLMSIGMRTNPYGQDVAGNSKNIRTVSARSDPRQQGLFAASFLIGLISKAANANIEALALSSLGGDFAANRGTNYNPLFQALKTLTTMRKQPLLSINSIPENIFALACKSQTGGIRIIMANCSLEHMTARFSSPVTANILDSDSVEAAVSDNSWRQNAQTISGNHLDFAPCSLAFVELEADDG